MLLSPISASKGALLDVKDISVNFGGSIAIKHVSIEIPMGIIVSVIGANGAGKTTLLRTICGSNKPASGSIWFENKRIDALPTEKIVQLGIAHVPEGRMLFKRMSVLENLLLGTYLQKEKAEVRKRLDETLERFPALKSKLKQRANSLSGGEQQMVAIGRALMSKPKFLLADETSLGLAPLIVEEIVKTLIEINAQGVTILLVEQNAYIALKIAQRAYVLERGEVVLTGSGDELMQNEQVRKSYLGL